MTWFESRTWFSIGLVLFSSPSSSWKKSKTTNWKPIPGFGFGFGFDFGLVFHRFWCRHFSYMFAVIYLLQQAMVFSRSTLTSQISVLKSQFSTFISQIPLLNHDLGSLLNSHFSKIFVSHYSTFQYSPLNSLIPSQICIYCVIGYDFVFANSFVNDIYDKTAYYVRIF